MLNKKMQYVIKTCSSENVQELQNLLNEMSMNGWELYSMHEVETDEGVMCNCIFMSEISTDNTEENTDIINISTFKSQMEKILSPKLTPYEKCLEIQSKIRTKKANIAKIKQELEVAAPASIGRKKLNDKISAALKELEELKYQLSKTTSTDEMYSRLHEDKLAIHLSEELLGYIDPDQDISEEELVAETVKLRLKLTENLGYVISKIIFQDSEILNPYEFSIRIHGLDVFKSFVYPDCLVFFAKDLKLDKKIKNSHIDIDQITGEKIIWIEKDKAKDFWQKGLTGTEFISRALEFCAIKHVEDLLDYEELDKYIDIVTDKNLFLVENIIPDFVNLADLRYILTSLIKEKISIKDIVYIFEKINDFADSSSKSDLIKKIRLALSRQICHNNMNSEGTIQAIEISEKTISSFEPNFEEDDNSVVRIDADFAEKLAKKVEKQAKLLNISEIKLFAPLEFRHLLFTLLSNYINNVTVLAREEIGCNCNIEIIGEV